MNLPSIDRAYWESIEGSNGRQSHCLYESDVTRPRLMGPFCVSEFIQEEKNLEFDQELIENIIKIVQKKKKIIVY